jgi:hypothetical protein
MESEDSWNRCVHKLPLKNIKMAQNNNSNLLKKNPLGTMRLQVPATVDVKGLVAKLNLSSTVSYNIKNKIYYFLSLIVSTNDNYRLDIET